MNSQLTQVSRAAILMIGLGIATQCNAIPMDLKMPNPKIQAVSALDQGKVALGGAGLQVAAFPGDVALRTEAPMLIAAVPEIASNFQVSRRFVESRQPDAAAGLQLPEPGPASAIIATLALAVFFASRRLS